MVHSAHGEYCLFIQLMSRPPWSSIFSSSAPSFVHHDRLGKSAPTFPKAGQAAKGSRQPWDAVLTFDEVGRCPKGNLQRISKFPDDSEVALTFDDVLIRPAPPTCCRAPSMSAPRVTRSIGVHIPILSSAMDTVTEARLAIAMAQAGGIGVIHRNLDPEAQAAQVAQVKKFESGMVVNPVTIHPARHARRCAEADGRPSDLRHPGGRAGARTAGATASSSASSPIATCASPPIRTSRCTS